MSKVVSASAIGGLFVVGYLINELSSFWTMYNALQILYYIPIMDLNLPD